MTEPEREFEDAVVAVFIKDGDEMHICYHRELDPLNEKLRELVKGEIIKAYGEYRDDVKVLYLVFTGDDDTCIIRQVKRFSKWMKNTHGIRGEKNKEGIEQFIDALGDIAEHSEEDFRGEITK